MMTSNLIEHKKNKIKKEENKRRIYLNEENIIIYRSAKGSEGTNYNGKAFDKNGGQIYCKHLAWYMSLHSKKYHNHFKNIKSISEREKLKNNEYDSSRIEYKSKYYNFFLLKNFGNVLYSIAKKLEKDEQKVFMLNSENHAMTLIIEHKFKKNKKQDTKAYLNSYYVVKFYDPNKTTMHKRAVCATLKDVQSLSIKNFLSKENLKCYFPKLKLAVLFSS
ncbi:MAG: ShET2/EspL2 family type III secretion system effector toxin, partial [Gammaproteobacteria bacterium]